MLLVTAEMFYIIRPETFVVVKQLMLAKQTYYLEAQQITVFFRQI